MVSVYASGVKAEGVNEREDFVPRLQERECATYTPLAESAQHVVS